MEARETVVQPTPASQAEGMVPSYTSSLMDSHAVGGGVVPQVMSMGISMNIDRSLGGDLVKKKRGRPRKYGGGNETNTTATTTTNSNNMALALAPFYSPSSPSEFSPKRGRGRPPGSGKRQLLAALGEWVTNSAGGNFTPHVVTIAAGEDVAMKILSFAQKGPRAICILSANGAISNVTLRQPGSSGGILTYEGRFEILSLSGSFALTENGGVRSRTGGISVSLAGPDGRVVGGGVAGLLLAASPIQVVVGSFIPGSTKEHKRKSNPESSVASPFPPGSVVVTAAQPISHIGPVDSCATPRSGMPIQNLSSAENIASHHPNPYSASFHTAGWPGSQSKPEERASPDINVCLPGV